MAATLAPAFQQATTSAAISAGWVGRWGFCDLCAMPPVGAMVTITLRLDIGSVSLDERAIIFGRRPPRSHCDDIWSQGLRGAGTSMHPKPSRRPAPSLSIAELLQRSVWFPALDSGAQARVREDMREEP